MQVPQIDYATATGGTLSDKAVTIEMNAFAFQSLINNLYADKIQSPLRELATNARDGHAKNGNLDEAFDVHLPTEWDQTFWIRDYGCSLTPDFMDNGYLRLFHSTKRDSNLETGILGLGRVSPFAYTDTYTITTWQDGVERVYSAYMGADGTPHVAKLHEGPSNERTGVMVSFPVKSEDLYRFRSSANAAFFGFNPFPNILNETYVRPELELLASGTNWDVYEDTNWPLRKGVYAQQGSVVYPVDREFFQQHMPEMEAATRNMRMVVEFPIGQLAVATSREALAYDDHTVANLKAGLSVVVNELTVEACKEVESAASYWDACTLWQKMQHGHYDSTKRALSLLVASQINWKGMKLDSRWQLEMDRCDTPGMFFEGGLDLRLGSVNHNVSFRQRAQDVRLSISEMKDLQVVVQFPDCKFAPARMRRVLSETDNVVSTLWMRPASKEDFLHWQKSHGGKDFIDLSTIEPLKVEKKSSQQIKFRMMKPTTPCGYYQEPLTDASLFTPHKGMFFMVQDGPRRSYMHGETQRSVSNDTVHRQMHRLVKAGILPEGTKIMMLNKTNRRQLEKQFKFTDLSYVIRKKMKARYGEHIVFSDHDDYRRGQNVKFANKIRATGVPLWGDLKTFCDDYPEDAAAPTATELTKEEKDLISYWLPDQVKQVDEDSHQQRLRELEDQFPLINSIDGYGDDYTTRLTHYLNLEQKAAK